MSAVTGTANAASLAILQESARHLQTAQKRVATGIAVFGAGDDAVRYELSSRLLARSQQLNRANQNISIVLKSLEATDRSIETMFKLIDKAADLAADAQSRGTPAFQGTRSTTDINADTLVSPLAVPGSRLSIVMDGGQSFTFTFGAAAAATRWGTIVDAINSADIGIIVEYIPATAPSISNLRFRSTGGRDFRFGGDSDRNVIAALGAITSGTGGTLNLADQFVLGAAAPTAAHTGLTISFGGAVQSVVNVTAATAISAGSAISFSDGNGRISTWTASSATTVSNFIAQINGMNAGVIAELVNSGAGTTALRLRNGDGGNFELHAGSGAFDGPVGLVRFGASGDIRQTGYAAALRADHSFRLGLGRQYDDLLGDIERIARNNPSAPGANLLDGASLGLLLDGMASTLAIDGAAVSAAGTLGLTQAGSTWTTFSNILTSATQIGNARTMLLDIAAGFAGYQRILRERHDLNRDFAADMHTLGGELVAADVAAESARLTALEMRQRFAVEALAAGAENRSLLSRLIA